MDRHGPPADAARPGHRSPGEVHRDPAPAPEAPYGWRYAAVQALGPEASVAPLAAPQARIAVADLLP